MSTKKKKTRITITPETDTSTTIEWLSSLSEANFRDVILEHLFKKMQKQGIISWFKNIHGRNDKGIDFLVKKDDDFGSRIIGIQAKSVRIIRSDSNPDASAVRILAECVSAMNHEFDGDTGRVKLDNIELWNSNHITQDAEAEFKAPGVAIKVQIKRARDVSILIEKFCPEYLTKIPQLALSAYIQKKQEPVSKTIRLLGVQLNPKQHFIRPKFSSCPSNALPSLSGRGRKLVKDENILKLGDLVFGSQHSVIVGSDLCGKSYLLEHLEYLIASKGNVPVVLPVSTMVVGKIGSIQKHIAKHLNFLSEVEVDDYAHSSRIYILIDDFGDLSKESQAALLRLDPLHYKIIATSASWSGDAAQVAYITGVDHESIPEFLRSIDRSLGTRSFTDRAHAFIYRTLSSSGLASNPFTIAIILTECQSGGDKLSTPTMGRLIERFVELQLGSHSDVKNQVDFETKREFLTKLGGTRNSRWTVSEFRRILGKFIERKSHPHKLEDFYLDLIGSGVFSTSVDSIKWSHPIIAEFFWVKNLIGRKNTAPILMHLKKASNTALSAVVGSQMQNAGPIIEELMTALEKVKLPSFTSVIDTVRCESFLNKWIEGTGEEELLREIENDDQDVSGEKPRDGAGSAVKALAVSAGSSTRERDESIKNKPIFSSIERERIKRKLNGIAESLRLNRFYIAMNLASVLINSRDTDTAIKVKAVQTILESTDRFGGVIFELVGAVFEGNKRHEFLSGWTRLYFQLQLCDQLMGDPFLINIFKRMLLQASKSSHIVSLLDLIITCGEDDYSEVILRLRGMNRIEVTFSLYMRVVVLYYFRFHKERDKKALRSLMKDMRLIHKGMSLPIVE